MTNNIPKSHHSVIRVTRQLLNIPEDIAVTYDHLDHIKAIMQRHLDSGLSPSEIRDMYGIVYSDFGMFLKKSLGLTLKSHRCAVNNYLSKTGRALNDDKQRYKFDSKFRFDPYLDSSIPGFDLLLQLGIYHPVTNPTGVCRDHILSIESGWRNQIDPSIISHPANCQFITNQDNIKKGSGSHITIDELIARIDNWGLTQTDEFIPCTSHLPKTVAHKQKISAANSKYMNVTDGKSNQRLLKGSAIPNGFRRGLTHKRKMVGEVGIEPTR